jgi:hypothetical protein
MAAVWGDPDSEIAMLRETPEAARQSSDAKPNEDLHSKEHVEDTLTP